MRSFPELLVEARNIIEGFDNQNECPKESIDVDKDLLPNMIEVARSASEIKQMIEVLDLDEGINLTRCPDPIKDFFDTFLVHIQFEMTKVELEKILSSYWFLGSREPFDKMEIGDFDYTKYEGGYRSTFDLYDTISMEERDDSLEETRVKFVSVVEKYISEDPYFNFEIYSSIVHYYYDHRKFIDYSDRLEGIFKNPTQVYDMIEWRGKEGFIFKKLWKSFKSYFKYGAEDEGVQAYEDRMRSGIASSLFSHFLFSFRKGLHLAPTKSARK
jgi:hypothetical protein